MSLSTYTREILVILQKNAVSSHPQLTPTNTISEKLQLSQKETSQLLKILQNLGFVESNEEATLSLITHNGLRYLNETYVVQQKDFASNLNL